MGLNIWKLLGFELHVGQKIVWDRKEKYILISAGTGGGKTSFGVLWTLREIINVGKRSKSFIIGAPTRPMLSQNILPQFEEVFTKKLGFGKFHRDDGYYEIKHTYPGLEYLKGFRIYFRHLTDPDVIEGIHAGGAWIDEAGQKSVPPRTWKVLKDRLRRNKGRVLFTTTPYIFNWLYFDVVRKGYYIKVAMDVEGAYARWQELGSPENSKELVQKFVDEGYLRVEEEPMPDYNPKENIVVVSFPGILNPTYDISEFFKAKQDWDEEDFEMRHLGLWTAYRDKFFWGFTKDNIIQEFEIPESWPRYIGVDFGVWTYFAAVWVAKDPETGNYYVYRTYKKKGKDNIFHARMIHQLTGNENIAGVYTDPSGGFRREDTFQNVMDLQGELKRLGRDWEFRQSYQSFTPGVSIVNRLMLKKKLFIVDTAQDIIFEMENLRTEEVEKKKNPNKHCADALRYVVATQVKLERASKKKVDAEKIKRKEVVNEHRIITLIRRSIMNKNKKKRRSIAL